MTRPGIATHPRPSRTSAPAASAAGADVLDGRGCVAIPGLVNAHHHLYQVLTRVRAQQAGLFGWLTELYPVWAGLDAEWVRVAAAAGLAELAHSGCSTSTDHPYIFPTRAGDLLAAEIEAARTIGLRFHPCRGSMDLGASDGGCLLYTSPSPRDRTRSRMPSSA